MVFNRGSHEANDGGVSIVVSDDDQRSIGGRGALSASSAVPRFVKNLNRRVHALEKNSAGSVQTGLRPRV